MKRLFNVSGRTCGKCWLQSLGLIGAVISLFAPADPLKAQLAGEPGDYPVPVLELNTSEKATVVALRFFETGEVELESAEVIYGFAHGHIGDPPLLNVELLGLDGASLDSFDAWDPLWAFEVDASGHERKITLPEATGVFTFPFRPNVAAMRVTDPETQQELSRVDLIPATHDFCRQNAADPECENVVNRSPGCDANGPYFAECAGASTRVTLDGSGSSDPDGDPIRHTWTGPFLVQTATGVSPEVEFSGLGNFAVNLQVDDDFGSAAACSTAVTVRDTTPPEVACNAPTTIAPPDAPISFKALATDVCGAVVVRVSGFDCFTYTKKGKRIDKTSSCKVSFSGDTVTILDSGGVGDNITWIVSARDGSGNESVKDCAVEVVKP